MAGLLHLARPALTRQGIVLPVRAKQDLIGMVCWAGIGWGGRLVE